jgi:hypothetical protein
MTEIRFFTARRHVADPTREEKFASAGRLRVRSWEVFTSSILKNAWSSSLCPIEDPTLASDHGQILQDPTIKATPVHDPVSSGSAAFPSLSLNSTRTFLEIASPMRGLDIVWMVISP